MTVKRNTTATSATGTTKFSYDTVAEHVLCSMQDGGGSRLKQDDVGQVGGRRHSATFGPEADLQQNDLVVEEVGGETFRVVHVHEAFGEGGAVHHKETTVEQWIPAGGD